MKKFIDHLVWAVQDLEAAKKSWETLGFQATPRGTHPFGTANHLLMADQFFVELLSVMDPSKVIPNAANQLSFSALNQAFLAKDQGVSMIVLASEDAEADVANYRALGLKTYPPTYFSRGITLPDGTTAEVAFSIAFVVSPASTSLSFFICQHYYPVHFWKKDYQLHANSFVGIKRVVLVVETPEKQEGFFSKLLGTPANIIDGVYQFTTPAETILLMTRAQFRERNGVSLGVKKEGVQLVVFQVKDLHQLQKIAERSDFRMVKISPESLLLQDPVTDIWLQFEKIKIKIKGYAT
ncbi:MAG: VOC family protein [Saprospiraceae bacterium]